MALVLRHSEETIADIDVDNGNRLIRFNLRRKVEGRNRDQWQAEALKMLRERAEVRVPH